MHPRQPLTRQRRGTFLLRIQADLRLPFGFLPAPLGTLEVSHNHRTAQRRAQRPGCHVPGGGQHLLLNSTGRLIGEHPGRLGDQPRAGKIDHPGGQRLSRGG